MPNTIPFYIVAIGFIALGLLLSLTILAFSIYSDWRIRKLEDEIHGGKMIRFSDDINFLLDDEDVKTSYS